jgi:hypothetical protein
MRDRAALDLPLQYAIEVEGSLGQLREDGSDPSTHWPEMLRLLRAARFRGFVMLDHDGDEAADTAMPRGARYMRGLLHLMARREVLGSSNGDGAGIPADFRAIPPVVEPEPDLREILAHR